MNFWEQLYAIASMENIPTTKVSEKAGLTRAFIASSKTQNVTPNIRTVVRLLDACGYALCAVKKDNITSDCFVIAETDETNDQENRV